MLLQERELQSTESIHTIADLVGGVIDLDDYRPF